MIIAIKEYSNKQIIKRNIIRRRKRGRGRRIFVSRERRFIF